MVSDGSDEHAGLLADMRTASDEKIGEIISAYTETLPEEQKELAEKQAELLTDAEGRIKELSDSMKEEVDAMDLSNEARESAYKTIDSYADEIISNIGSARSAAQSCVNAVKSVFDSHNLSFNFAGVTTGVTTGIKGYASGTMNASEDIFIAGENGPELIVGMRGSTVFPASETAKIISAVNALTSSSDIYGQLMPFQNFAQEHTTSVVTTSGGQAAYSAERGAPSVKVYIGNEELKSYVINAVYDENAASGGQSI